MKIAVAYLLTQSNFQRKAAAAELTGCGGFAHLYYVLDCI